MQRQIAFGIVLALALAGLPSQSEAAGCSGSILVALNVSVKNRDGNPVLGLKQNDFSVTENGKKQFLAVFAPQGPELESAPVAAGRNPFLGVDHRLFTFFFDFTETPRSERARIQDDAIDFIHNDLKPGELLSIETATAGSVETTQDFTNDQSALVTAVNKFRTPEDGVTNNIIDTHEALSRIANVCKSLPIVTKKSLLYFSAAVDESGSEDRAAVDAAANACTKSGVAIYPIGAVSASAAEVATKTGGQTFSARSVAIDEARRKTGAYYVLGYYSPDSKEDGKYRKVELKLTHPNLQPTTLDYLHGYFGELPEPPKPPGVPQPVCFN